METLIWKQLDSVGRQAALMRPSALADASLSKSVATILSTVKQHGDQALADFTRRFDGVLVENLQVPPKALEAAWQALPGEEKQALQTAKKNIEAFHLAQIPTPIEVETMPGVLCRREVRPIESAGLYVPGGSAPLISTLMMLAVPAKIANVPRRIVTTPPDSEGRVDPRILACAWLCQIEEVFMVGGAQAIAALAYGTETIPKTAKIFGPGNAFVARAKSIVAMEPGGPAIDLPAGPSEVMVLADDQANPVFVAADLLSQAEHDAMAQVIFVCRSEGFAARVETGIKRQTVDLSRREIVEQSLASGRILIADSRDDMVEIANAYAPEHLIIQTDNPDDLTPLIRNAGSIFLGPWTPESVGDYASGTNHTLPTFGAARAYSGVVVESFMKFISVQKLTRQGLEILAPTVECLAGMEGLDAHARAVSIRLDTGDLS